MKKETAQREQATQAHTSKDLQTLLAVYIVPRDGFTPFPRFDPN